MKRREMLSYNMIAEKLKNSVITRKKVKITQRKYVHCGNVLFNSETTFKSRIKELVGSTLVVCMQTSVLRSH